MYEDLLGKDRVYVESEMRHRGAYHRIIAPSGAYLCYKLRENLAIGFYFVQKENDIRYAKKGQCISYSVLF